MNKLNPFPTVGAICVLTQLFTEVRGSSGLKECSLLYEHLFAWHIFITPCNDYHYPNYILMHFHVTTDDRLCQSDPSLAGRKQINLCSGCGSLAVK